MISGSVYQFNFGDGNTRQLDSTVCTISSIVSIDTSEIICKFTKTYSSATTYTAFFDVTRSGSTNNNALSIRIPAKINLAAVSGAVNNPPSSATFPITRVIASSQPTLWSWQLPSFDPEGDTVRFALSTTTDVNHVNATQPPGLTLSETGDLVVNTSFFTPGSYVYYSASIQVTDSNNNGITLDFTLAVLRQASVPTAPTFVSPTPSGGAAYSNLTASPVAFAVSGSITGSPTLGFTYTNTPASAAVTSQTGGFTVSWSPSDTFSHIFCFAAVGVSSGSITTSATPRCVVLVAELACPHDCYASFGNGRCQRLYGRCRCTPGYCWNDCGVGWRDPAHSAGCTVNPGDLGVSLGNNNRGNVTSVSFEASIPSAPPSVAVLGSFGNELWVGLPAGATTQGSPDVMISVPAVGLLDNRVTGVSPSAPSSIEVVGNVVQLRWNTTVQLVATATGISFTLTNIRLPNNCDPMAWQVTARHCPLVDVLNGGVVFKRQCDPTPVWGVGSGVTGPTSAWRYNHQLSCDLCNACRYWQPCPDGSDGFVCEHSGVTFTRCGSLASPSSPCDLTGVTGSQVP